MKAANFKLPELGGADGATPEQAKIRFRICADSGLLRHAVPEDYGGFATSYQQLVEYHTALGEKTHDPGLMLALNAHLWGAVFPILRFGNEAQKKYWLPQLLDGEWIGGHAITEPHAGSDIQAMKTFVTATTAGYELNGHKRYITNTPVADIMVVYAKEAGSGLISAFIVKRDDKGASFQDGPTVKGCTTATMGDIILSGCLLPEDRALGASGAGGTLIQLALELERAFIFAGISGVMQWQLQQTVSFARNRMSGTAPLSQCQAIAHKIAGMKLRLETTRLWIQRCAALLDEGRRITSESAQAKLYASEAFLQSSLDAVHIQGARGMENNLTELVADAVAGRLMSGSSEVQKNIIAAMLGVGAQK